MQEVEELNRHAMEALKAARQLVGDTKAAPFARRLGLADPSSYRRWEAGTQTVPAWALIAAAAAAGVSVDDLLKSRADSSVLERLATTEAQYARMDRFEESLGEIRARTDERLARIEKLLERLPKSERGQ